MGDSETVGRDRNPSAAVTGVQLIRAERARQKREEGWTADHDDSHDRGELARAAAVYATPPESHRQAVRRLLWPWSPAWYKPSERIRELVKAGALIAAEIDRLRRLEP